MSIGHVLIDLEQIVWTQLKCVWLAVVLMPEDLSLHWWGDYAGRSAEPDDGGLPGSQDGSPECFLRRGSGYPSPYRQSSGDKQGRRQNPPLPRPRASAQGWSGKRFHGGVPLQLEDRYVMATGQINLHASVQMLVVVLRQTLPQIADGHTHQVLLGGFVSRTAKDVFAQRTFLQVLNLTGKSLLYQMGKQIPTSLAGFE